MIGDCECCADAGNAVGAGLHNRPGLSAVAYRLGTFSGFRKAILDTLSRIPALAALRSRASDDYTITAVELWAAVADVLAFYQERTANEGFLGTATQRDSVLRLVRLIDYQLRPGAAATTRLAFTLEAGTTATIAPGTRVQSVPGEGEKPQKFETLAPLNADARLNKLRFFAPPISASPMAAGSTGGISAPDPAALKVFAALAPGDEVIVFSSTEMEVLKVASVSAQDEMLAVRWETPISGASFVDAAHASPDCQAWKLGRTFRLFGFDAPETVVVSQLTNPSDPTTAYLSVATTVTTRADSDRLELDARYAQLKPGARLLVYDGTKKGASVHVVKLVQEQRVTLTTDKQGAAGMSGTVTVVTMDSEVPAVNRRGVQVFELLGEPLRFWEHGYPAVVATGQIVLPGRRVGWSTVEVGRVIEKGKAKAGTILDVADLPPGREVILTDGSGGSVTATIKDVSIAGSSVQFSATEADGITIARCGLSPSQTSRVTVLVSADIGDPILTVPRELSIKIGPLPARTISLASLVVGENPIGNVAAALETAVRAAAAGAPTYANACVWSDTGAILVAAGVAGDSVSFGPSRSDPDLFARLGFDAEHVRFLDGVISVPPPAGVDINGAVRVTQGEDSPTDKAIVVNNTKSFADVAPDALGVRVHVAHDGRLFVLPQIPAYEPRTHLCLRLSVPGPFALDSAHTVLLGNIATASHGETVRAEIVGDGDAAQTFQSFALRKKPVTYVPAAASGGVTSSLQLLVQGVRWSERATLYGARPTDEVYIARIADDGTLSVKFGDGLTGARLPTGRRNIVASYRQGIGLAGRVGAGKLTNLLDRASGVKGVANPAAADGGADPETMDRARLAAPGTVRTFGRAISLRDFEDASLLAGEVAKASARLVWTGRERAIHLTVAAQGGALFSTDGLARLVGTLAVERDPNHRLMIANYVPIGVIVEATLEIDPRYVASTVLATARTALLSRLSFDERTIAQPLYVSDIYAVLQNVEGVSAVDVDRLDLKSEDPAFRAERGVDDTQPQPQSRLLMLPARPGGTLGVILPGELATIEAPSQDVLLRASGGM